MMGNDITDCETTLGEHLHEHEHIALDFDDCLLDGPYSRLLTDYIASHPEKSFSIEGVLNFV